VDGIHQNFWVLIQLQREKIHSIPDEDPELIKLEKESAVDLGRVPSHNVSSLFKSGVEQLQDTVFQVVLEIIPTFTANILAWDEVAQC
jgi:hypothetical protein